MHKLYNITLILSKKYIPKGQRDNLFRVYIHEVKKKESFLILDKEDIPPPPQICDSKTRHYKLQPRHRKSVTST